MNMKMTSRQLQSESRACEKKQKESEHKVRGDVGASGRAAAARALVLGSPHPGVAAAARPAVQVLECMKKGNDEMAKIYAADAIRAKNEALNFLRLSSRIDAVAGRVRGCRAESGCRLRVVARRRRPDALGRHPPARPPVACRRRWPRRSA
jgi:hypothetical protein